MTTSARLRRYATRASLAMACAALLACGDSPSDPEPDPDPDPGPSADPAGFRILHAGAPVFEWAEGDPMEADTLRLTWPSSAVVRFLWLSAAGDSVAVPMESQLIVTTADDRFVVWDGGSNPVVGSFDLGGYPDVETSFRVRLVVEGHQVIATPDLVLDISEP